MNPQIKLISLSLVLVGLLLLAGCMSPLNNAVNQGDIQIVKALLDKGANVNEGGYTPLMIAAGNGDVEMVKLLIAKGADINRKFYHETALGRAVVRNRNQVVDMLMENGANVDLAVAGLEEPISINLYGIKDIQMFINQLRQKQKLLASRTGWTSYSRGEFEKSIAAFNQAIQQNPTDAGSFAGLAACHDALGQYDEAVTAAKQAISLNPQAAIGHVQLGTAYWHRKQLVEAEKELKLAIDLEPRNPDAYVLARYYLETAQYHESLQLWNRIAGIVPANSPFQLIVPQGLMVCHYALGKYDDAITDADRFIDQATRQQSIPAKASAGYAMKSLSYREKADGKQADEFARKAMELNPSDGDCQLAAGVVALDKGQFADAIKILLPHPTNNIILATAHAKLGQFDVAAKLYQDCDDAKFQKAVPGLKARQAFLAAMRPYAQKLIESAKQLEASQQPEAALAELAKAVTVAEDDQVEAVRTKLFLLAQRTQPKESEEAYRYAKRGDLMVGEGNLDGAIGEYNKALRLAPYSPRLYFNAALIHGTLKNYTKAIQYMKTYAQLAPNAPNIQAAKDALIEWDLKLEKR